MLVFLVHCNLRQYHRFIPCLYVFVPPMSSQKRNPDDGDAPADGDNPDDKRRKFSFFRYCTVLSLYLTSFFDVSSLIILGFCYSSLQYGFRVCFISNADLCFAPEFHLLEG